MLCRHCGRKISLLRRLTDAEFCNDRHRADFLELEKEAALARLTESGARIIPQEPPTVRKGPKKQVKAKDEIPAPLAGILTEPLHLPKTKRRIPSSPRMMGWPLIQELPQFGLTVQARRMDLAGGIQMESQPARLLPLLQTAPPGPEQLAEGAGLDVPPVAGLALSAGPAPVRNEISLHLASVAWMGKESAVTAVCRLSDLHPVAGGNWPRPTSALDLTPPRPVNCGSAHIAVGPGLNPQVDGLSGNGFFALPSTGGESREVAPTVSSGEATEAADPAQAVMLAGLMRVDLFMCSKPHSRLSSQLRAFSPRRRLVGPRVPQAEAAQLQLSLGRAVESISHKPLRAPVLMQKRSFSGTMDWGITESLSQPRFSRSGMHNGSTDLKPAGLCSLAPGNCVRWHWTACFPPAHPNWFQLEASTPRLLSKIDGELKPPAAPCEVGQAVPAQVDPDATHAPEASRDALAAAEPAPVEASSLNGASATANDSGNNAPGMVDRQFPLFVCRGLKPPGAAWIQTAATPAWQEQLERLPLIRPMRLIPDHADGSGARVSEIKPAEPSKPWLSIHLPSLPVASWRAAPADLKWITLALPVILLLALYSFLPTRSKNSVETATAGNGQATALSQRFETIRTAIMQRAAVKLADDFRAGLGAWEGNSGWAQTWTYTDASFVSPGQLALYRPSLGMKDYVFAFLGQIDRRSLNWVVRARDENNYVAMRIVMTRSGPMPAASLVRYAVLNGKMDRQTTLPLPVTFREGTMQQVEVTVAGDTITTRIMGQVVDSFSEDRLADGGVGFYSPKGDRSLLRWVSITHQYDYIGRLCALLAPYNVSQEARRKG